MELLRPVEDPRARHRRSWVFDGFVVVVAAFITLPAAFAGGVSVALIVVVNLAMLLPLVVRRLWPVPVFAFSLAFAVIFGWWVLPAVSVPALVVALYTVAAHRPRRDAFLAAGAFELAVVGGTLRMNGWDWWAATIPLTAFVVAACGLGLYVGTRRAYLGELRDRAARLERERDQQGALAAASERSRIAREMHDIVAHNLTVMVALSDGAAATAARSPEQAAEVMRTVSATGRQALADTRRLLGVLRDDLPGDASRRPLPDLTDLDELLARVRAAGLPVRYEVQGATRTIPSGVQLTLFRLVQEALTNTMKHGGEGATATVRMHYATDEVRVDVEDDGVGEGRGSAATPGRGIAGMQERVTAFGGDVFTGPRQPHGWQVSARMHLDQAVGS